jgi:hypothetical protein
MDYPERIYWSPISISMPPDNQLVAIKMMGPRGYRYAIGCYSKEQRDLVLVAKPETEAKLEAISWIALPR